MVAIISITAGFGTLPNRKISARLLLKLVVEGKGRNPVLGGITGPRCHWGT
jgi:hypothetical protein